MTSRALLLLILLFGCNSKRSFAVPLPKDATLPAHIEKRMISALDSGNHVQLQQIQREISRLDGPTRAELRFRISEKEVEFEFHGIFPFAETQPESLEYLVSMHPHQNHETLLAVKEPEMTRLRELQKLLRKDRDDFRNRLLESHLCWMEGRERRCIKLDEILQSELPKVRADFIKQLEIMHNGLGGSQNVKGQRVVLPQEPVEAWMILVIPRKP